MPSSSSLVEMVLSRLERLSADSPLAHRASGIRGSLLRSLEERRAGDPEAIARLNRALEEAFDILEQAALERQGSIGAK